MKENVICIGDTLVQLFFQIRWQHS